MSPESQPGASAELQGGTDEPTREKPGLRTHILLVIAMAVVIACVTTVSLLLVRHRLRMQVTDEVTQDLKRSVVTFQDLQAVRLEALDRENALLADLPTLKALMTSSDDLTIQDGAVEFWELSGNDLFALADSNGRIIAAYTKGSATSHFAEGLRALLTSPEKRFLIDGSALYACSVRPLYFGTRESGSVLGYVIGGVSIERTVRQISQPTSVEATFVSKGKVVATTLSPDFEASFGGQPGLFSGTPQAPTSVRLLDTRFLAATEDLSSDSTLPLELVVLKSMEPAELSIDRINHLLLLAGLLALVLGTALMIALSKLVTRPLEELSRGVRAFGEGDVQHRLPSNGTQEVRELSTLFARMRREIQQANQALLESERLATIGRMASSVSHDLRHYLAAVFANAEFLATDRLSPKDRSEILADIRMAVDGTTEMIESLLIFSRTGDHVRRSSELMATLLERASSLVRSHPDAEGVTLITRYGEPTDTAVVVDPKPIERAIYNLLLNACQSVRASGGGAVTAELEAMGPDMVLRVSDTGGGVPHKIKKSLFHPFVSEGKQKGTGLGLTIASAISAEHQGEVVLVKSDPGETVFEMRIPREVHGPSQPPQKRARSNNEVIAG